MRHIPSARGVVTGPAATQEIRLAVVLNGGVSLAVWMSGVTHELNRLVQASRRRSTGAGDPDAYLDLLEVLDAEARIDVIAGTSAGGINGGFLALGLVHGADLDGLRDLWQDAGSLSTLLRNPRDEDQPSLLRGGYFHQQLADAYKRIWTSKKQVPAAPGEDVDLFLTGTLWQGRRSFYADDMGRRMTEQDYDATFHFTSDVEVLGNTPESRRRGNLHDESVTDQLAVASRCTASFPAAFEPFRVFVDAAPNGGGLRLADGRWASDAGRTNFELSQFVIDGGILRNKPIRPAIDAVYRQPADQQVRRILTYVVPDPGEPATGPGKPAVDQVPGAADVMLGVLTRLRSTDSVSDELAEIERRNQETTHHRRSRDRIARTLLEAAATECADTLLRSAYPGYLEVRREDTAESVARLLASTMRPHSWSRRELAAELRVVFGDQPLPFLPREELEVALTSQAGDWHWGHATVRRLGDLVVDVLKRAVWLAPLTDARRAVIVDLRGRSHRILQELRGDRDTLDAYWRDATLPDPVEHLPSARGGRRPPDGDRRVAAKPEELRALRERLRELVAGWDAVVPRGGMTARLHERAVDLARCLLDAGDALRDIAAGDRAPVDHDGVEQGRLRVLVDLLVPDGAGVDDVLHRMLRLEVLHVALTGVMDVAEQGVELVQVSSLREDLVTGVQLHHFGAFYRESWRANDWLRGRLDGSEQLVQMLLAPERLRQLGVTDAAEALRRLQPVAVGPPGGPWHAELAAAWDDALPELTEELDVLRGSGPLPRTFPVTAERIAERLRVELLPAELRSLAAVTVAEPDPVVQAVQWADRVSLDLHGHEQAKTHPGRAELAAMLRGSEVVGQQTIAAEGRQGSDTFARTVTHAAATLTAAGASITKPKAALTLLKAVRGYGMLLWVLVNFATGGSRFGRNLTHVVLGVGGALVALALIVPGVPALVPLTGVVLVLACAGAAALRHGSYTGWGLALRIVLVAVLAVAALAAVVWQRAEAAHQTVWEALRDMIPPVAVVLVVVLLGWFLGHPAKRST